MDLKRIYEDVFYHADPRTKSWLLLEESPVYVWMITCLYLFAAWQGPKWMSKRNAFVIPVWFIVTYNFALVILSIYMFVEILTCVYNLKHNWLCAVYNRETYKNPDELRLANVLWWYFFSKVIEFGDTLLMILRKKDNQITFLHVFHHSSILNFWWFVMTFTPGGCAYFSSALNSFVHIVMYTYYGLSVVPGMKKYLWWKRYITRLQLGQFVAILLHTLSTYRPDCDFPNWGKHMLAAYMLILLVLFSNFYLHAYNRKSSLSENIKSYSNGEACNNTNDINQNGTSRKKFE